MKCLVLILEMEILGLELYKNVLSQVDSGSLGFGVARVVMVNEDSARFLGVHSSLTLALGLVE